MSSKSPQSHKHLPHNHRCILHSRLQRTSNHPKSFSDDPKLDPQWTNVALPKMHSPDLIPNNRICRFASAPPRRLLDPPRTSPPTGERGPDPQWFAFLEWLRSRGQPSSVCDSSPLRENRSDGHLLHALFTNVRWFLANPATKVLTKYIWCASSANQWAKQFPWRP